MAAGKPIIATRVGEIPNIINGGDSGLLVPPKDSIALTSAIEIFLRDKQKANAMALAARNEVSVNYSSSQMALKYIEHYKKLIS